MKSEKHDSEVTRMTELSRLAAAVLCEARAGANSLGKAKLKGAHCYVYAALLADFVHAAKQGDWIGPKIRMPDSTIKGTDQVLMEHFFGVLFAPIRDNGGAEFLSEVQGKASRLLGVDCG